MKSGWMRGGLAALCAALVSGAAPAQIRDPLIDDAQDAWRKRDRGRLAMLRASATAQQHPLAPWVDYWELNGRLGEASQADLEAFYARWRGAYVEDRLRNDWLLELGRRRDWANFRADFPRFRMNDDRQVTCFALLADHADGKDVRDLARAEWFAQRDADDGCHQLATTLHAERRFADADVWRKLKLSVEYGRPRAAKQAASMLDPGIAAAVAELVDQPARYLTHKASVKTRSQAELAALALGRMAASDAEAAAGQLDGRWQRLLPVDLAAWAWAITAKQSAQKLLPDAHKQFQRAHALARKSGASVEWSDDVHAWQARAALRTVGAPDRWQTVRDAIAAMGAPLQKDPAWVYWKSRALFALAEHEPAAKADEMRLQARAGLLTIASPLHFYGQLAAEDLELNLGLPALPAPAAASAPAGQAVPASLVAVVAASQPAAGPPLTAGTAEPADDDKETVPAPAAAPVPAAAVEPERDGARSHPGLARALQLISIGLRNEGVREWNYSLRGMTDRQLIGAAQWACEREVWDRCINTSDRTRHEVHVGQRYPMPFRAALEEQARELGVDPAYVFGLIRQESRFVIDARSSVGAAGLMQVMPNTARWVAKKIGLPFKPESIGERDVNLKLGTAYLKLVLDDFGGSQAMAAAAYNAGPARPRRWREGPLLETPIWAENIPFPETRDYVKKVLANATVYARLLGAPLAPTLKARLGSGVGPRDAAAPEPDRSLP